MGCQIAQGWWLRWQGDGGLSGERDCLLRQLSEYEYSHRLNIELDLQSLLGLIVLIG